MKRTSNTPMTSHVSSPSPPSINNRSQTRLVNFPPSEIQRIQGKHKYSLHAKILGPRVGYDHFSSHIHNIFRPSGNMEVSSLLNDFFLIKFSDHSDYQKALQNSPWTINNCYIALLPWTANFNPSAERSIARIKVWIRLYGLPVEYYDKEALSRIAEEIGPLVKIDPVTESMSICKFARFCVDLDLSRQLVDSVDLPNGFSQKIKYEGLRYYQCWGCRMVGHVQKDCPESTSIASQEVRLSWGSPGVLARTPPGDPCLGKSGTGSKDHDPDISSVHSPGELRIRPLDVAPDSSVADAGSDVEVPDISRKDSSEKPRTPPFDAAPKSSGAPLLELQIPDQEATFIDSVKPCIDIEEDYFPNVVSVSRENENQEIMTPGSVMKYNAILLGVEVQEVIRDPVEIQEVSNAGLPKVFKINSKVRIFSIYVLIYSNGNGNLYRDILAPVEIDHTPFDASPTPEEDVVLFFNCRGAREAPVIRALKELVERYSFSVVVLTETKTGGFEAGKVIGELGFSGKFMIEPVENSGGVWLLWDENRIDVEIRAHDQHYFYAIARAPVIPQDLEGSWLDVGVWS